MTPIDIEAIKRWHTGPNRQKNCHACRGTWPCEPIEMVREIETLRADCMEAARAIESGQTRRVEIEAERDRARAQAEVYAEDVRKLRDRLASVLNERDDALMKLSTAYEERGAFRRQRDEARQALAALANQIGEGVPS